MVNDDHASSKFVSFINSSPFSSIILISTYDDASLHLTKQARQVLANLGAENSITFRDSFALVSQNAYGEPTWFREKYAPKRRGPVSISVEIVL